MGSGSEELIERTAFVSLEMRERDPTQAFERQNVGYSLVHLRKHPPLSGVKEQRIVIYKQVLIVGDSAACDAGNRCADAKNGI
jgi:hypothetical protein